MLGLVQWFSPVSWPDSLKPDSTPPQLPVLSSVHSPWASFRGDLGIGKMLVINPSWVMGMWWYFIPVALLTSGGL